MADRFFGIKIESTTKGGQLQEISDKLPGHLDKILELATLRMGEFVAARAQANAPVKSGDLRSSANVKTPTKKGDAWETQVSFDEPYSLRMHEELTPVGPLQLGPISIVQPPTPEGGVGGRFLARSVERNVERLRKILGTAVENNLPNVGTSRISVRPITGEGLDRPARGPIGFSGNILFPS